MSANLLAIFYLISGVLFILALRGLSSPETSRKGNLFGFYGYSLSNIFQLELLNIGSFNDLNFSGIKSSNLYSKYCLNRITNHLKKWFLDINTFTYKALIKI